VWFASFAVKNSGFEFFFIRINSSGSNVWGIQRKGQWGHGLEFKLQLVPVGIMLTRRPDRRKRRCKGLSFVPFVVKNQVLFRFQITGLIFPLSTFRFAPNPPPRPVQDPA